VKQRQKDKRTVENKAVARVACSDEERERNIRRIMLATLLKERGRKKPLVYCGKCFDFLENISKVLKYKMYSAYASST